MDRKSNRELAEQLIDALRNGSSGARVGPDGEVVAGIPDWEEATKDQRFAEKAKTHGWPMGLAKSARWKREALLAAERANRLLLPEEEVAGRDAAREALAWALDAERFLGSFSSRVRELGFLNLHSTKVDEVAEHLEIWLRERGYEIRKIDQGTR